MKQSFIQSKSNLAKNSSETLFNLKGEITDGQTEKVFSKSINIYMGNDKSQDKYFIRTLNNVPLDPFGPEARREIWNRTELRQVSKLTFEAYNNYLMTKNRLFFTKTNRGYING